VGAKNPIPFGKYYLLDRVNVGGMAEVWRAKTFGAEGFEKITAIKRILPNIAEDEEFIHMFIDEAKISVSLSHANISQVFDLGKISDSYFIAMEYVSGKDLRAIFDRCRKKGEPAPVPMTCYIMGKVCEGLDYAHRKKDHTNRDLNIVHRDVSPANVLVSFEGEIKVIDFGIAKAANKATKTQAGILKGKFGYMSPEQVRGLPLDRRSDVFALGVVLYEMLAGERLFVGETDFSVLEKVRQVDILPPSHYNRRIPEPLEKIVYKALAKEPEDRYQYASDLADDLQKFLIAGETVFGRKDLMQYMKSTFAEDFEREKVRLAEYAEVKLPPTMALAAGITGSGDEIPPTSPGFQRPASLSPTAGAAGRRSSAFVPVLASSRPPGEEEQQVDSDGTQQLVDGKRMTPSGARRAVVPPRNEPPEGDFENSPTLPPKNREVSVASRRPSGEFRQTRGSGPMRANGAVGLAVPARSTPIREIDSSDDSRDERVDETLPPQRLPQTRSRTILVVAVLAVVTVLGAFAAVLAQRSQARVIVIVDPPNAQVFVDQKPVIAKNQVSVSSGEHQVEAKADGFQSFSDQIKVGGDDTRVVDIKLKAINEKGTLVVVTEPEDAQVSVDNKPVKAAGSRDAASVELSTSEEHTVTVEKPGYRPKTIQVRVEVGKPTVPTVHLEQTTADVYISTSPPGADVSVDGRRQPNKTPTTIRRLDLSHAHSIQLSKPGYETVSVPLKAGDSAEIPSITLSKVGRSR
jgi:eukaryotic-like serine/threonine-protein kinase